MFVIGEFPDNLCICTAFLKLSYYLIFYIFFIKLFLHLWYFHYLFAHVHLYGTCSSHYVDAPLPLSHS